MKRFAITLATIATALSLSVSAEAGTKTTKQCTCKTVAKTKVAKKPTYKKTKYKKVATKKVATKRAVRTSEININIPADLRIDEKNNAVAVTNTQVQRAPSTSVVVPVTRVIPTAPARRVVDIQPVDSNTVKRTTTTTVPVEVETVPVVVNP